MIEGYKYCLILALKWIQRVILDTVLFYSFGWTTTYGSRTRGQLLAAYPKTECKYEESAQLARIWFRGSPASFPIGANIENFLYVHNSYVHPEIVIGKTNISLLSVTAKHFIFAMTPHKIDVYNYTRYKSISAAQYEQATHLILLPHWAFEKVMTSRGKLDDEDDLIDEGLPDEKKLSTCSSSPKHIIAISTSGCSGTVLLSQLLGKLPNARVISYPWVYVTAHRAFLTGQLSREQYGVVVKLITTYFCRHSRGRTLPQTDTIVLKLPIFCTPAVELIAEFCPQVKHVFSTRSPRASVEAIHKTLKSEELTFFNALHAKTFWAENLPFPYDSASESVAKTIAWLNRERKKSRDQPHSVYAALAYCTSILSYLRNRDLYATEALYHDDLIRNPNKSLIELCARLNIDSSGVEDTLPPYNPEIVRTVEKLPDDASLSGEDNELIKDVFFMLKVPFDVDTDKERLLHILNRRKRKIGRGGATGPPPVSVLKCIL